MLAAGLERGEHVVGAVGQDDAERGLAVVRAVVGVGGAVAGVEVDLPADSPPQRALEPAEVDIVDPRRPAAGATVVEHGQFSAFTWRRWCDLVPRHRRLLLRPVGQDAHAALPAGSLPAPVGGRWDRAPGSGPRSCALVVSGQGVRGGTGGLEARQLPDHGCRRSEGRADGADRRPACRTVVGRRVAGSRVDGQAAVGTVEIGHGWNVAFRSVPARRTSRVRSTYVRRSCAAVHPAGA